MILSVRYTLVTNGWPPDHGPTNVRAMVKARWGSPFDCRPFLMQIHEQAKSTHSASLTIYGIWKSFDKKNTLCNKFYCMTGYIIPPYLSKSVYNKSELLCVKLEKKKEIIAYTFNKYQNGPTCLRLGASQSFPNLFQRVLQLGAVGIRPYQQDSWRGLKILIRAEGCSKNTFVIPSFIITLLFFFFFYFFTKRKRLDKNWIFIC